jgi:ferredoxin
MTDSRFRSTDSAFLLRRDLQRLLQALMDAGYQCLGPQVRDDAIVYERLTDVAQLPRGITDSQNPGEYRLHRTASPRCYAWAVGPQALKPLVFQPVETLWQVRRVDGRLTFEPHVPTPQPTAVLGVRACDLAALQLLDAHFLPSGQNTDDHYRQRRESLFLIAVDCSQPAATCFCHSTGDGPAAHRGYDIVMAELDDGYLLAPGSDRGAALMAGLPLQPLDPARIEDAEREQRRAEAAQQRRLDPEQGKALLDKLDHPRWDDVAERCLACGNCTAVCPTCFCFSEADEAALDGSSSEHYRQWDSCFSYGHSYIHGQVIHSGRRERYRQWLSHKVGNWHFQYGRSGCVGCGRCLTWCPVGIDITEEVAAICHGN